MCCGSAPRIAAISRIQCNKRVAPAGESWIYISRVADVVYLIDSIRAIDGLSIRSQGHSACRPGILIDLIASWVWWPRRIRCRGAVGYIDSNAVGGCVGDAACIPIDESSARRVV